MDKTIAELQGKIWNRGNEGSDNTWYSQLGKGGGYKETPKILDSHQKEMQREIIAKKRHSSLIQSWFCWVFLQDRQDSGRI